MALNIIKGDLFSNDSDAIVLNVDGLKKGMEGFLARQFMSKYPELWKELQTYIKYPIPLGEIFIHRPENHQYKLIVIASTLNHTDDLSPKEREDVVYSVFKKALKSVIKYKLKKIATGPMSGGWRVSAMNAFVMINNAFEEVVKGDDIDVNIYISNEYDFSKVSNLAKSMGW